MSGIPTTSVASHGIDVEDEKEEIRKRVRDDRKKRSSAQQNKDARALADIVCENPVVRNASCVATYVAVDGEPGTEAIIAKLRERGVRVLLPVLGVGLSRDWAEDTGPENRVVTAPGRPPEPQTPHLGADAISQADVVLAPALSIDTSGNRLGQGGGWFDRALLSAREDVVVVALVHDKEFIDAGTSPLPIESHDLPVHAVATPQRWIAFS